jgi:hypothetical protein
MLILKVKVKDIYVHAMRACVEWRCSFTPSHLSAVNGEWSASCPRHFTCGEGARGTC